MDKLGDRLSVLRYCWYLIFHFVSSLCRWPCFEEVLLLCRVFFLNRSQGKERFFWLALLKKKEQLVDGSVER